MKAIHTQFILLGISSVIFVLLISPCYSQSHRLDSLQALLPGKSDGEHIDILIEISRAYINSDKLKGLDYSRKSYEKAKRFGDSLRIVKAGRLLGQGLRRIGKHDSAQILFKKMLPVAKRNAYKSEIKTILNALGVIYVHTARHDEALKYLFESLDVSEADNDVYQMCVVLNNIGLVYVNLFDYEKAIYYFNRVIAFHEPTLESDDLTFIFLNKVICLVNLKRYVEAAQIINRILADCGTKCSAEVLIMAYQSLAEVSFYQKNLVEAQKLYLRSYKLSKESGYELHHMGNLTGLIQVHTALNELQSVDVYLKEAEVLDGKGSSFQREMGIIYSTLITVYKKLNNTERTSFYQDKYIALRDKIFNEQLTTNLMKIEAEHLEKENKSKIEAQNKILALNEEVMLRQKYLNVFIGVVAVLLFALAFVLYRSNRQKQKINFLLDSKVKERTQQLESSRNLLQRASDERDLVVKKTVADVMQVLATIKGLCIVGKKDVETVHNYLEKVNTASDCIFDNINRLVEETTSRASSIES